MRIALCDDEEALAQSYAGEIQKWADQTGRFCQVSLFASPQALLFECQEGCPFHLLLLDIEMPGMNGMELARALRRRERSVVIAFLTNYDHFVFEGYEVGAFRYLMKSQVKEKLRPLLEDAAALWEQEKEYLLVSAGGGMERLELNDIVYLEASRHDTILHTAGGSRLLRMPISRLAGQLPGYFVCAHRSFLVNLHYLERLSRTECVMSGGACVPVGRKAYGALSDAFIAYYKEQEGLETKAPDAPGPP